MDTFAEDAELPEGYLSPRSKLTRMMADIDDAPTPSPKDHSSRKGTVEALASQQSTGSEAYDGAGNSESTEQNLDGRSMHSEDDDEDSLPQRPTGRAARRMLQPHSLAKSAIRHASIESPNRIAPHNEEDLYSATPSRSRFVERVDRDSRATPSSASRNQDSHVVSSPQMVQDEPTDSENDMPLNPLTGKLKLARSVAGKRKLRRELFAQEEETESASQHADVNAADDSPGTLTPDRLEGLDDGMANKEVEKILSDAARPTRKASKQTLENMRRETQRLVRQQGLAHDPKVRKRYTKEDLFQRFKFRQPEKQPLAANADPPTSYTSSSAPNSDGFDPASIGKSPGGPVFTPPSSPPTPLDRQKAIVDHGALAKLVPIRQDNLSTLSVREDGKDESSLNLAILADSPRPTHPPEHLSGNDVAASLGTPSVASRRKRSIRDIAQLPNAKENDSDDDLDIIEPMPAHLKVFDRIIPKSKDRKAHSKAIHMLKQLSYLPQYEKHSLGKHGAKMSMSPQVVNDQLMAQAKAQAHQAQLERLAELKAKGVVVLSVEEREREAEQFENLLEKARGEALELRKKEHAAAKKVGDGEAGIQASDDEDEDDDWVGSDAGEVDDNSGSDVDQHDMVDDAAEETEEEGDVQGGDEDLVVTDSRATTPSSVRSHAVGGGLPATTLDNVDSADAPVDSFTRRKRKSHVIVEDDEDEDEEEAPAASNTEVESDDPFAAFAFGDGMPAMDLMSPTQAFNATMQTPTQLTQSLTGSRPGLGAFSVRSDTFAPPPSFYQPATPSQGSGIESQSQLVPASQLPLQTQEVKLDWDSQMPETPIPSMGRGNSNLLDTPGWEPSQDGGLPSPWDVSRRAGLHGRAEGEDDEVEACETQSTVRVRISESPEVVPTKRKGRLNKGVRTIIEDDSEDDNATAPSPKRKTRNAFTEMQKRRLESLNATERAEAEREARAMMEEQAEESEDEYAGLGGDDTDMIGPETEEDRALIDESHVDVNELELARLFADRQRAAEEEATKKLYKDVTTGGLRRRNGAGWELDEDEDEIFARRRQMKQREEARKRKLLLEDENVKGLLEGGRNSNGREAFLRAIADDDDAEDMIADDHDNDAADDQGPSTQNDSQVTNNEVKPTPGPLREISSNKRRFDESQSHSDRPLAKTRRTREDDTAFSRPTSMLQVRESVSFLLDEPSQPDLDTTELAEDDGHEQADEFEHESEEDDEVEAELARANDGGYAPNIAKDALKMPPPPLPTDRLPASQRRTPAKAAVIDRLSLKRASSSSSNSSVGSNRSAWSIATGSAGSAPSLLRRATSNLSAGSGANERGVSFSNGAAKTGSSGAVSKSTGGRKSSLAYQARAEERKNIVERTERKREEGRRRIAEMRRKQGGGLVGSALGLGQWE